MDEQAENPTERMMFVRGVPIEVHERIRKAAQMRGISMAEVIVRYVTLWDMLIDLSKSDAPISPTQLLSRSDLKPVSE